MITAEIITSTVDMHHDGCPPEELPTGPMLMSVVENTVHETSSLWPARQFMLTLFGAHHDYTLTVDLDYEDEDPDMPGWTDESRREEFATALHSACRLVPDDEPIRFIVVALRMPDYSVCTILLEADGDTHDSVSTPHFTTYFRSTYAVSDIVMEPVTLFCQKYWGKAWQPERCHHTKAPGSGLGGIFIMPLPGMPGAPGGPEMPDGA